MKVYTSGASSKDAGTKITTITELKDIGEYRDMVKVLLGNAVLSLR